MKSRQDVWNHLTGEREKRRIVPHSCMSPGKSAKQIVGALKHHLIGVEIKVKLICLSSADVTVHSLMECVRKKVGKYVIDCDPFIAEKANDSLEDSNKKIKMNDYGERKQFESDGQTAIIIYASVGLVAVTLIAGSVWDLTRPHDQCKEEEGTGTLCRISMEKISIEVQNYNNNNYLSKDQKL